MKLSMAMLAAALLVLPGALRAQETDSQDTPKKGTQDKGAQGKKDQMPQYQPGKEHMALRQWEGDWEFKSKCTIPGQETQEGQGTETVKQTLGGFWLEIEDKGTMMGKEWNGKGFMGWDPQKKQYCGVWLDSWMPFIARFEGDADSTGKVFTFKMMGEDPKTGKPMSDRMVFEWKDQDHRMLRFYTKDESGKEVMMSEITYTRKPAMIK